LPITLFSKYRSRSIQLGFWRRCFRIFFPVRTFLCASPLFGYCSDSVVLLVSSFSFNYPLSPRWGGEKRSPCPEFQDGRRYIRLSFSLFIMAFEIAFSPFPRNPFSPCSSRRICVFRARLTRKLFINNKQSFLILFAFDCNFRRFFLTRYEHSTLRVACSLRCFSFLLSLSRNSLDDSKKPEILVLFSGSADLHRPPFSF